MILKTFTRGGTGTIVIDDDATNEEIAIAMMLDAMEEHSSTGKPGRKKEDKDGQRNTSDN